MGCNFPEWPKGQVGGTVIRQNEILIGDEFSVIILDVSCCFLTKIILWMYRVPSDIS